MKIKFILGMLLLTGLNCVNGMCDFVTPHKVPILKDVVRYHNDRNYADFYTNDIYEILKRTTFPKDCGKQIMEQWKNDDKPREYRALTKASGKCVTELNQFKMFDKISYCNLQSKCRKFLSSQVNDIKKLGASNDVAQRYSLMCAFDISWDDSVKIMKGIAKEGPFSHEYSLEEALFITHMHTKMPNAVSRWLKGNEYHEEELTYAGCLASSLATVLKADEKLPEDFTFDHAGITTTSRESFINMNIRKFIDAYLGGE